MKIISIDNWDDERRVDFRLASGEIISGYGETVAQRMIEAMPALRAAGATNGEAFAPIHEEWRGLTLEEVLRRAAAASRRAAKCGPERQD